MRAAGIPRHVAADGAHRLRRRVGCIKYPRAATRWVTCALITPSFTTTCRLAKSTSRMRFMRARLMTIAPAAGSAPPLRPVPAPRLTKGILSRAYSRTTACARPAVRGSTTASGITRKFVSAHSYVCNWLFPVISPSAPTAVCSSSILARLNILRNSLRDESRHRLGNRGCHSSSGLSSLVMARILSVPLCL
jgi:hypothetical protein